VKTRVIVVAVIILALGTTEGVTGAEVDRRHDAVPVPELIFSFPNLEGDSVSLSDERYRGKVVLIDIMGTWCGPCRRQAPTLQKFYEKYRDQGFEVLGVAFERSSKEGHAALVSAYAEKYGLEYQILLGGTQGEVKRQFPSLKDVVGLFPTTIFVDREGKVEGVEIGYEPWMDKDLEWNIQYLLKTPVPGAGPKSAD
jgi:thiol-disulfide isomerase/thioredoxin